MTYRHALLLALAASILGGQPVWAHETMVKTAQAEALEHGTREAAAVVDAFHAALASGDVPAAFSRLSEDAMVFESGGAEKGKAEYAAHHAPADAAFVRVLIVEGEATVAMLIEDMLEDLGCKIVASVASLAGDAKSLSTPTSISRC